MSHPSSILTILQGIDSPGEHHQSVTELPDSFERESEELAQHHMQVFLAQLRPAFEQFVCLVTKRC